MSLLVAPVNFVAIDFETANAKRDSACAIGLAFVDVKARKLKRWHSLIKPPTNDFHPVNVGVHGLTWADCQGAPTFAELWPAILEHLEGASFLVAHNAAFDKSVLKACCELYGLTLPSLPFECSVALAKKLWPGLPAKLNECAARIGYELQHHDAGSDAEGCARVVLEARKRAGALDAPAAEPTPVAPPSIAVETHDEVDEEWLHEPAPSTVVSTKGEGPSANYSNNPIPSIDPFRLWLARMWREGKASIDDLVVMLAGGDESALEGDEHPARFTAYSYAFGLESARRIVHLCNPDVPIRERELSGTFGPNEADTWGPERLIEFWPPCPKCMSRAARVKREQGAASLTCAICRMVGTPSEWATAEAFRVKMSTTLTEREKRIVDREIAYQVKRAAVAPASLPPSVAARVGPTVAKATPRPSRAVHAPARASPPPAVRVEPAKAEPSIAPPKQAGFEWAAPPPPKFAAAGGRR